MAQDRVGSLEDFIARFPQGGEATVTYIVSDANKEISVQVLLPNKRFLTYVHKPKEGTHGVIKRQAEGWIAKLDAAKLAHCPLRDDSPTPVHRAWGDIAGSAVYPMVGEDAQAWVSRSRNEDEVI